MLYWITVTCSGAAEAKTIARNLLKARLAVCSNVVPNLFSQFAWKGKIESSKEALLILKTTKPKLQKTIAAIIEQHSYDLPAIEYWAVKTTPALSTWVADALG
jgi:periplasmic divalent cation tolerance protein